MKVVDHLNSPQSRKQVTIPLFLLLLWDIFLPFRADLFLAARQLQGLPGGQGSRAGAEAGRGENPALHVGGP